ncbi:hypothetical protein J4429_01165 [Candidatus Pacearchaeota archaeon]|nr:hypothetical protein [Candidatus Pacearchaeota archaeon]
MVEQDFKKFYESLNKELIAVKDRVRSLIGKAHWGEDGRYREAVLKNVISKFLPKSCSMGTGFVINKDKEITKQIDIIIYDSSSPVLFAEGDFVIVLANTVKAIIEVKSSIKSCNELKNIIKTCEENAKKIETVFSRNQRMFNGVFCYECKLSFETLKEALENYFNITDCSLFRKVNNISLGNKKFLHLWEYKPFSLRGYELRDLSFAYFISNLLVSLDSYPIKTENQHLFFPLVSKDPFEKFRIDSGSGFERYL